MSESLLEIIGGLIILVLGWLGYQQRELKEKVEKIEDAKVDKLVYQELRKDYHQIVKELVALQVEIARWQGRMEIQDRTKPEKS